MLISPTYATIWQRPDRALQGSTNFLLERDAEFTLGFQANSTGRFTVNLSCVFGKCVFYELALVCPKSHKHGVKLPSQWSLSIKTSRSWACTGSACDTSAEVLSELGHPRLLCL